MTWILGALLVAAVVAWRVKLADARLYRRLWLDAPSVAQFDELKSQHEGAARAVGEFRRMSEEYERLRKLEGVRVRQIRELSERVAAQSELLSKAAERDKQLERRDNELVVALDLLEKRAGIKGTRFGLGKPYEKIIYSFPSEPSCRSEYPRGLEAPPKVEDPLSPTWCRPISEEERAAVEKALADAPDGRLISVWNGEAHLRPIVRCQILTRGEPCQRPATGGVDGKPCCDECRVAWEKQEFLLRESMEKGKQLYRMYEERFGKKAPSDPSLKEPDAQPR